MTTRQVPEVPIDQRILVTVEVAAGLLSISRSLAYELVAEGKLPHVRLSSGTIRISPDALSRWVNREVDATPRHTPTSFCRHTPTSF